MEDIWFAYPEGPPVLKGLDFTLPAGGRIGITGPNGAGKSTLFMLAMGLLVPDKGKIWVFGKPMATEEDFRQIRTRLGYCFQDPDDQLFCATVREDVAFGPLNQGRSRQEVLELVEQTLERLGLTGFAERVTYHLSGGEKRLVSLATVLAMQPEALLLDEPTAGLDEDTRSRLEEILLQSELAWAIVSHDRDFLERTCHQILAMKDGTLAPADRRGITADGVRHSGPCQ